MNSIIYDPRQSNHTTLDNKHLEEIVENIRKENKKIKSIRLYSIPYIGFLPSTISPQFIAIGLACLVFTTFCGLCSKEDEPIQTRAQAKREINRYLHGFGSPYRDLSGEDIDRLEAKVLEMLDRRY